MRYPENEFERWQGLEGKQIINTAMFVMFMLKTLLLFSDSRLKLDLWKQDKPEFKYFLYPLLTRKQNVDN